MIIIILLTVNTFHTASFHSMFSVKSVFFGVYVCNLIEVVPKKLSSYDNNFIVNYWHRHNYSKSKEIVSQTDTQYDYLINNK